MTVTLETLREDFEAARRIWAANEAATMSDAGLRQSEMTREEYEQHTYEYGDYVWFLHVDCFVSGHTNSRMKTGYQAYLKANIIDVAERHGLQAAMTFKISDGLIDPSVKE